jgi:hypothetical protein
MRAFNPYLAEELILQSNEDNNLFGLIGSSESNQAELHGYEVTMSGRVVLPELTPLPKQEEQWLIQAILC